MKKKFGDRRDGKRVKVDGLHQLCIDLKPRRCDADVYINQSIDVTNLIKFIEKKPNGYLKLIFPVTISFKYLKYRSNISAFFTVLSTVKLIVLIFLLSCFMVSLPTLVPFLMFKEIFLMLEC